MSYKLFTDPRLPWSAAETFCEEQGGHLVDVTSENKSELTGLLIGENVPKAWIHTWDGNAPDCLVLYRTGNITAANCRDKLAFILELDD